MKKPVVDIGRCTLCGGCIDLCPSVFVLGETGFVMVRDLAKYPETLVDEAIKYCPEDCIEWEDS